MDYCQIYNLHLQDAILRGGLIFWKEGEALRRGIIEKLSDEGFLSIALDDNTVVCNKVIIGVFLMLCHFISFISDLALLHISELCTIIPYSFPHPHCCSAAYPHLPSDFIIHYCHALFLTPSLLSHIHHLFISTFYSHHIVLST